MFLYIFFTAGILIVLWVVTEYRRRSFTQNQDSEFVWKCTICSHKYIDSVHKDLSQCPLCGSYNEKGAGAVFRAGFGHKKT